MHIEISRSAQGSGEVAMSREPECFGDSHENASLGSIKSTASQHTVFLQHHIASHDSTHLVISLQDILFTLSHLGESMFHHPKINHLTMPEFITIMALKPDCHYGVNLRSALRLREFPRRLRSTGAKLRSTGLASSHPRGSREAAEG